MKHFRLSLAVAACTLAAGPAFASAGYVNNGDQWAKMSPQERVAYVQGLNDTANFTFANDDLATGVVKAGRTKCLIQTKMAPNMLADVITNAYDKNPQLKGAPPYVVYIQRLADICRPVINQTRVDMGLPPQ